VFPKGNTEQTLVAVTPERDAHEEYQIVDKRGPVRFAPLLVDGEQPGVIRNRTVREDREHAERSQKPGWEHEWLDWDERLDGRERSNDAPNRGYSSWDDDRR